MPVYSPKRYEEEVEKLKKFWLTISFDNILQAQTAARKLSASDLPPWAVKRRLAAPPEGDVVDALLMAVDGLGQPYEHVSPPPLNDIYTECVTGDDIKQDSPVIFYVHGGGFMYGSPGTARRVTRRLAKLSHARCFAVQYRYATQQPFPGPLLDVFVAYLSLINPADDAVEIPIPSKQIVLAGESSGFNLVLSLVQLLLYLRVHRPSIRFHGRDVKIELPSGIAGICGFMDITCGLPSWSENSRWDYLVENPPTYDREQWEDQEIWPAEPARADVYCDKSAMVHTLVSPVAASSWKGCPPLFIACGEERNADGNLFIAKQAAMQRVAVDLRVYEHMTHSWPTLLPHLPHSAHVLEAWARQCQIMVRGHNPPTRMHVIAFDTLEPSERDIEHCTPLTRDEVLGMMDRSQQARAVVHRNTGFPKL